MRVLLILLIFLSTAVTAEEDLMEFTVETEKKSLFQLLKELGKSDCEAFIDNGDALVNASLRAGVEKDWDQMFYYDEHAFETYLKAYGYCDDEPENKQKAKERLEEHYERTKLITCVYHMTIVEDTYNLSTYANLLKNL